MGKPGCGIFTMILLSLDFATWSDLASTSTVISIPVLFAHVGWDWISALEGSGSKGAVQRIPTSEGVIRLKKACDMAGGGDREKT